MKELLKDLEDAPRRRQVAEAVADVTGSILAPLGLEGIVRSWPGTLRDYVWLDGVRSAEQLNSSTKAMLVGPEGEVIPFQTEAPETPQWAAAYQQTRDAAFVFCPSEIAIAVALAAEKHFRQEYGVHLPSSALVGMRRSTSGGEDERRSVSESGFYGGAAPELLPLPDRLRRGDVAPIVTGIASRLTGYLQPLVKPDSVGRDVFGAAKVKDFIHQFMEDGLIDVALAVLGELELIDRAAVVAPLRRLLQQHPTLHEASLVVFGSAADSSSIATYFGLDVSPSYPGIRALEMGDALARGKPIVFIDDIIGSGHQAAAIVDAWFGDTTGAAELGETREPLPQELHGLLRRSRSMFCFAVGLDGGDVELQQALERNLVEEATVLVGRAEATLPTVYNAGDITSGRRQAFIDRCALIGEQLLTGQPEEKRQLRSLGYGNKGLLITFPYNTPSQTLTCLWESGIVDDRQWTALLPRRRKR
jgi:deoxynucleoside triphosphate triphosphohydrolase SAMHD1